MTRKLTRTERKKEFNYLSLLQAGKKLNCTSAPVGKLKHFPNKVWRGGVSHGYDNEDILEEYGIDSDEIKNLYEYGAISRLGDK